MEGQVGAGAAPTTDTERGIGRLDGRAVSQLAECLAVVAGAALLPGGWARPAAGVAALLAVALVPRPRLLAPGPWTGVGRLARPLAGVGLVSVAVAPDPAAFARGWVLLMALVEGAAAATRSASSVARRRPSRARRILIAGHTGRADELRQVVAAHRELGLLPVPSFVDPERQGAGRLARQATRVGATAVVVVTDTMCPAAVRRLIRDWPPGRVSLHLTGAPAGATAGPHDDLWGFRVWPRPPRAPELPTWKLKRALDVAVAGAALVVLAPVFAAAAAAIRLTSGSPVLFRQTRVGQHGRHFTILKFRTMPVGHDAGSWNAAYEARPTSVGGVLRRTSIDELPQLLNVLRGDMSLVGPRPEIPAFVEQFSAAIDDYADRHRVPTGLTGWAQVHGLRGPTCLRARTRFDNGYIDTWTLRRDLWIVCRTFVTVVRRDPRAQLDIPAVATDTVTAETIDLRGAEQAVSAMAGAGH